MRWTWEREVGDMAAILDSAPARIPDAIGLQLDGLGPRVVHQMPESKPAPVDPMAVNQAIPNLHDFNDVDLLAAGNLARVLPDQRIAAAEPQPGTIPANPFVRPLARTGVQELLDLVAATQNTIGLAVQDLRGQRRLDDGVRRVERDQRRLIVGGNTL